VQHIPLLIPEGFELSWEISSERGTHDQEPLVATTEKTNPDPDTGQKVPDDGASTDDSIPPFEGNDGTGQDQFSKEITGPVEENVFDNAFQAHQVQFDSLIGSLEEFSSYCSSSHDSTVHLYQPFVQELKSEFSEIGRNFFTDAHGKDREALTKSFTTFKASCDRLSQKAEKNFKHNTGLWSYVKPILTGFVGVVIAIAATILTLGIATYHVAKNERLCARYIDTFFKSESGSIGDAKSKWAQYSVKQKLFGDESFMNNGLVEEIEKTISTKLYQ